MEEATELDIPIETDEITVVISSTVDEAGMKIDLSINSRPDLVLDENGMRPISMPYLLGCAILDAFSLGILDTILREKYGVGVARKAD